MSIKIALAGNPNSGKTTMFNLLTGSNQYVGNWPGVTVEKKEGMILGFKDVVLQDLPGIYSLSPYTQEEVVTRNYLVAQQPDAIINVVDATNIERNLYLTTQLLELGIPVIIAMNMIDVVRKKGDTINLQLLAKAFHCRIIETSALKGEGAQEVAKQAVEIANEHKRIILPHVFNGSVEHALAHIEESIENIVEKEHVRWYAIKIFEKDIKVRSELNLSEEAWKHIDEHINDCEKELDDDSESIIINQRYSYVSENISKCVKREESNKVSATEKIDSVITNKYLALPIFAIIIFLLYFISVSTLGAYLTDWTNGVFVEQWVQGGVSSLLSSLNVAQWLQNLTVDGIIGGVGAVLGFVPQILLISFLLAILEDVGYMSRIAFILDKLFRKFGLSGKSFIPMLVASGCGVPGIMASRTIESESDRRMTIMTATFVPCGAKIPIIALIAGSVFASSWWVAPSAYFLGICAVLMSGLILKKTKMFASEPAPFVMELPSYHAPMMKNVLRTTWDRGWSFIKKAGTVILVCSIVLWFLQNYGFSNGGFFQVEDNSQSLLAHFGSIVSPIFAPLGFGTWQSTVSTFTGLIAKENVVSTLGILYGFGENVSDKGFYSAFASNFTAYGAYAFLAFQLLCAPCFAAIGAIKKEMNSMKWTFFAVAYQCSLAYAVALIINQTGLILSGNGFTMGTGFALATFFLLCYLVIRKNPAPKQAKA